VQLCGYAILRKRCKSNTVFYFTNEDQPRVTLCQLPGLYL